MAAKDRSEQIDTLIDQLEKATQESTAGARSWDEFCQFLTNFETLANLQKLEKIYITKLIKHKHICYYIASDNVEKNPTLAAEILPKIYFLIQDDIFPNETDFFVLVDWLGQVTFLFEQLLPEDDEAEPAPVELLKQTLTISKKLVGFCLARLKHEKIHQTTLNSRVFRKFCSIAKQGVSQEYSLEINSKTIALIDQLGSLMRECQFVAAIGQEQFGNISDKLWTLIVEELRSLATDCFAYNYKINKIGHETRLTLYRDILAAIEHMPANDDGLDFFKAVLTKRSRPKSDATDLAILRYILRGRNYAADGIWPILDIHMSRGDPKIRIQCLSIARGLFGKDDRNIDDYNAMLKHLDLIIDDNASIDKFEDCQKILDNVVELLCSIPYRTESTRNDIQSRLIKILEDIPIEHLDEICMEPMIKAISAKHAYPMEAKLFRDVAIEKFKLIYQSGVEQEDIVSALRVLFNIATQGDQVLSYKRKYVDIVSAGCQGAVPKGCNKVMFSFLKKAKVVVRDETSLVPLAKMVYDQEDL